MKKIKLQFKSNYSKVYNKLFTLAELMEFFKKFHITAIGLDEIYYEFLKQLPKEFICHLI